MIRVQSGNLRNNHHSLVHKASPFSRPSSRNNSSARSKKTSATSIKENIPDLDKLINDIKISPLPTLSTKPISDIFSALKQLQKNSTVEDEVKAVLLLMQTIQKKIDSNQLICTKKQLIQSKQKRQTTNTSAIKIDEVSPIKQLGEDASSRIIYTNFSIKDIEKQISIESSRAQSATVKNNAKSDIKVTVSKFEEDDNNLEIKKLNRQILDLEALLQKKTCYNKGLKKSTGRF